MGSLKRSRTTSYRLSIETIALNCLLILENRGFCILATDKSLLLSRRSRCRERRLNNNKTRGIVLLKLRATQLNSTQLNSTQLTVY